MFLSRGWSGAPLAWFRHYLWGASADGGRAKAAQPRPEALVKGVEALSGVETAQRCAQLSNPPHRVQG